LADATRKGACRRGVDLWSWRWGRQSGKRLVKIGKKAAADISKTHTERND